MGYISGTKSINLVIKKKRSNVSVICACVCESVCVLSFMCVEEQEWVRQSKLFIQVQRPTAHYKDK